MERNNKHWTKEEDEYLIDSVGLKTYDTIAKNLGRTISSIEKRVSRLDIEDKHLMTGTFSASELARILDVDVKTVTGRWIPKGLKAKKRKVYARNRGKCVPYYINPEDFWEWAAENKHRINFSKIQRNIILPEPVWLDEQIKKDYYIPKNTQKIWDDEEDKKLWDLFYKEGLTLKEIAVQLNRSRHGVQRRLKRLRDKRLQTA